MMHKLIQFSLVAVTALSLQGCLATKIVTVPVKAAVGVTKVAVKGTAAAVRAVVPNDKEEEKKDDGKDNHE